VDVKLTAYIHIILTLGMRGLLLRCPIRLNVAQILFQHYNRIVTVTLSVKEL
jgi:hypothetical protein